MFYSKSHGHKTSRASHTLLSVLEVINITARGERVEAHTKGYVLVVFLVTINSIDVTLS